MGDDVHFLIAAAEERGRNIIAGEPRAAAAHYDHMSGLVEVELTNGCRFAFLAHKVEGLRDADGETLREVEVLGRGVGLHWENLDVDLSIPALLAGLFGTRAWMDRERAARAGAARSPAKAAAAQRNGMKGGRPRKQVP